MTYTVSNGHVNVFCVLWSQGTTTAVKWQRHCFAHTSPVDTWQSIFHLRKHLKWPSVRPRESAHFHRSIWVIFHSFFSFLHCCCCCCCCCWLVVIIEVWWWWHHKLLRAHSRTAVPVPQLPAGGRRLSLTIYPRITFLPIKTTQVCHSNMVASVHGAGPGAPRKRRNTFDKTGWH